MRRFMKISLALALTLSLLGCAAPKAPQEPEATPEITMTPEPATPSPTPEPTPGTPEFTLGKSVALVFGEGEEALLYAGFEADNTGDCPAVIGHMTATFSFGGREAASSEFGAAAGPYDVVPPGGRTFGALWMPLKGKLDPLPEGELTVEVEFEALESGSAALPLDVRNARVIQNYPGFATVSGSIWNETGEECPLNMVYTAYYDADDALLGVFHFTKNADIPPGEFKNFVTHLRQLPIEGLSERTARIETHAFGIE